MIQIKALLISALVIFTFSVSAQWAEVEWPQTDGFTNIDFVDDETGYAKMHFLQGFTTSFEKTEDGGMSWTEINTPVLASDIQDMDFISSSEGVIISRTYVDQEILTQVHYTNDDGQNWSDISPEDAATGFGMSEIQILDSDHIFFVIDTYFYSTTNGGADWNSVLLPEAGVSVNFSDANNGVIGTWDTTFNYFGGMLATTNGGETWYETQLLINNSVIGVVKQVNETTAYAAPVKWGAFGISHFYKTENNGFDWTTIAVPETDDEASLSGFDFRDENFGVITLTSNTQFYIYATLNGGETWDLQNQMEITYFSDLDLTPNSGYMSNESGNLLRLDMQSSISTYDNVSLSLFPNPTSSGQLIQWDALVDFDEISISDISGKTVFQENLTAQNAVIPNLQSGVYFLSLKNDYVTTTEKILVK